MNSAFITNTKVVLQLLKRDFFVFQTNFKDKLLNCLIWATLNTVVFHFIMPEAGLVNFGEFILISGAASWGLFAVMDNVAVIIGDIIGDKAIFYELTLPIPHWLVFVKIAISNTLQSFLFALFIIPIGKICLWNSLSFPYLSIMKLLFILFLGNLFYGFFSLMLASATKNLHKIDNIWLRVIFPLWFLGGYQFSWKMLYNISPFLGYVNLLNPLTYALEGARSAGLNPELSLPYWYCCIALIVFTIIAGFIGIKVFKKRLDCI